MLSNLWRMSKCSEVLAKANRKLIYSRNRHEVQHLLCWWSQESHPWSCNLISKACCPCHHLTQLDILWKLHSLLTLTVPTCNTEAHPYTWSWAAFIYHTSHILPTYLRKIFLNAVLAFLSGCSKWLLFQEVSPQKFFVAASLAYPIRDACPPCTNLPDFITILILGDMSKPQGSSLYLWCLVRRA